MTGVETAETAAGGSSSLSRWWSRLSRPQRAVAGVLGFVVALNVGLAGLRSTIGGGDPGGPVSSSYSTGDRGMEAFADLAGATGHQVVRWRDRLQPGDLPTDATVVVADPASMSEDEYRAILRFVADGGRLVVAGANTEPLLQGATGTPVSWMAGPPVEGLHVEGPADLVGAAERVGGDEGGRWDGADGLQVLASDDLGRPAVVAGPAGDGTVIALAGAELLHNDHLADDDNAALALGLVGGADRTLVFVESVHGFSATGIDALPSSWKWAAAGLALALAVGLWSAGSRLGPPEPQARALRPARLDHVRAVAADLDRVSTEPAHLVEPLLVDNRRALAERLRVAPDASDAVWSAAARDAGIDPSLVETAIERPQDLADALAVGRLAAERRRATLEPAAPAALVGGTPVSSPEPTVPATEAR